MSGHCLLKICKDKRHELSSYTISIGRKDSFTSHSFVGLAPVCQHSPIASVETGGIPLRVKVDVQDLQFLLYTWYPTRFLQTYGAYPQNVHVCRGCSRQGGLHI